MVAVVHLLLLLAAVIMKMMMRVVMDDDKERKEEEEGEGEGDDRYHHNMQEFLSCRHQGRPLFPPLLREMTVRTVGTCPGRRLAYICEWSEMTIDV